MASMLASKAPRVNLVGPFQPGRNRGRPWRLGIARGRMVMVGAAAWDLEFLQPEFAAAEGLQDRLRIATKAGVHGDTLAMQGRPEFIGERSAEQAIQPKAGKVSGHLLWTAHGYPKFLTARLAPILTSQDQQTGGGVQNRRYPALPDGERDFHGLMLAGARCSKFPRWISG